MIQAQEVKVNTDLRLIRDKGAIVALEQELRDNLWDVKTASENAGKTIKQTFANLPDEIKKIEVLCEHIKCVYADLERMRGLL